MKKEKKTLVPIKMSKRLMEAPIEELELSVRSYNCLKRAGFDRVGQIVNAIDGTEDLLKFRNMGIRSAREVMSRIYDFQLSLFSEDEQAIFLERVREMNENV